MPCMEVPNVEARTNDEPGILMSILLFIGGLITWKFILFLGALIALMGSAIMTIVVSPVFLFLVAGIAGYIISEARLRSREKLRAQIRAEMREDMDVGNQYTVSGGQALGSVTSQQMRVAQDAYKAGRMAEQRYLLKEAKEPKFQPRLEQMPMMQLPAGDMEMVGFDSVEDAEFDEPELPWNSQD